MGLLASLAQRASDAGLKRQVATLSSILYGTLKGRDQAFTIDPQGRWINHQPNATIVSTVPHTTERKAFEQWVLDNWAHQYTPRHGDIVVDVGAGVGEEAITFSNLVGSTGRVISIEAHPETYACLAETIRLSDLTNVIPLCVAVTDQDGTAVIGSTANHLANSIMTDGEGTDVPTRSLDSIGDELHLDKVDLLKMNIEGAERLAVRGMTALASRTRYVAISCHDFISDRDGGDTFRTFDEVRSWLGDHGFDLVTRPDHPYPWVRYYLYGRNRASD
jgi:FkbM family methyltransferase